MATTVEILSRVATRPTWAEVSLAALRENFRIVQKHVGAGVTVCAVVKADAYGHGAVECSRALEAEGASWLGVTSLDEAIPLPESGHQQNVGLNAGIAQRDGFVERSHSQPACTLGLEGAGAFDGAMTVGVGLYDGAYGDARADMLLHGTEILPQGGKGNFSPGGARRDAAQNFS